MFEEEEKWVDTPHHKFQDEIKQHLKRGKTKGQYNEVIVQMNKIWAIATDIYGDPSFLPSGKESPEIQARCAFQP